MIGNKKRSNWLNSTPWSSLHVWIAFLAFSFVELWIAIHFPESDVRVYQEFARNALIWPLFHRWPVEYPALSILVFLLPLLLPFSYRLSFALWAMVIMGVFVQYGLRSRGPQWGMRFLGYVTAGTLILFSQRYDIFVALTSFVSIDAAEKRRWTTAWTFLVVGVLLKFYPVVFVPLFLIQERRQTGRWRIDRLIISFIAIFGVVGIEFITASRETLTAVRYLLNRPVEVESLSASVTALFTHTALSAGYGSIDIVAHGNAHRIATGIFILGVIAGLWVCWKLWQGRLDFTSSVILGLVILLLASKVLSAQYLIWLAPLLAMRKVNRAIPAAYLITPLGYPIAYAVGSLMPILVYLMAIRNVLLLIGGISLTIEALHRDTVFEDEPYEQRSSLT